MYIMRIYTFKRAHILLLCVYIRIVCETTDFAVDYILIVLAFASAGSARTCGASVCAANRAQSRFYRCHTHTHTHTDLRFAFAIAIASDSGNRDRGEWEWNAWAGCYNNTARLCSPHVLDYAHFYAMYVFCPCVCVCVCIRGKPVSERGAHLHPIPRRNTQSIGT